MSLSVIAAAAPSGFEAPPMPAAAGASGDGLAPDQRQAAAPYAAAGMEGAPAATFTPPTGAAPAAEGSYPQPGGDQGLNGARPIAGGEIIARVGDQVVLASDVLWQVNRLIESKLAETGQTLAPEQLAAAQRTVMRMMVMQLIDTKLIFADFRRTMPPENLKKVEETIAGPFEEVEVPRLIKIFEVNDRSQLEEALKQSGIALKDVQRQFTEKTVAAEWLRQQMPKPKPITHEEMLAYYQDHLTEYEFPAQVRWEELMVRFDRVEGDRDAAWKKLGEMGNKVWEAAATNPSLRGPAFAEVAKQHSDGFTASQGGVHEWTTLGALKCEDLNAALATLTVGQMSNRIESDLGFHIVRVLQRKGAGRKPFTEVQAEIIDTLEAEQKEVLYRQQLEKIRKNARVWTIFDGELSGERLAEALDPQKKG